MYAAIQTFGIHGIHGFRTTVETSIGRGIPDFAIIGLGDASIREAKQRVTAAIRNQGYPIPAGRITVNLAPSGVRKEGTSYDAAIATGILCAGGSVQPECTAGYAIIGELSLTGALRPVRGVLSMVREGVQEGIRNYIVPPENVREAALVDGASVYGAESLRAVSAVLSGSRGAATPANLECRAFDTGLCLSQVRGQQFAKRALEIAASGGHNILLLGAPGSGKTMLARRLPGLLPALTREEAYEVTAIYSVSGLLPDRSALVCRRPFREVHAGITCAALTGGGRPVRPGEISLSHKGVLFLDEMTEMDRSVIEALRQPLESGDIKISRVGYSETLPADFILIGAANPCRCGYLLEGDGRCSCTPRQIGQTMAKLSKPLMDRIDLHVPVRSLRPAQMESAEDGRAERSETVRARVCAAWEMQQTRYRDVQTTAPLNARVPRDALERHCSLSASCRTLLRSAAERLGFSMRAYEKILRIARTVADMNGHGALREEDIAEAIQYRQLDLHADAELTVRRRA